MLMPLSSIPEVTHLNFRQFQTWCFENAECIFNSTSTIPLKYVLCFNTMTSKTPIMSFRETDNISNPETDNIVLSCTSRRKYLKTDPSNYTLY